MTPHRAPLPSRAEVDAALTALTAETGRTPSVLALATRLQVANTTFRRNFPNVCAELARPASTPQTSQRAADAYTQVKVDNDRLRRANRDLTHQLDLALAAIQRLSIDNNRLRTALHQAAAVTPLPRRPPPS
ncbi:hypothetical protein ABZV31_32595 [Streptomyces sp. NPDC005202]|uniref:hypothetical protein n=1 Tax=Streptomyces sp. NPDC005202 TaxID=3157021 RepID=UPI0033AB9B85